MELDGIGVMRLAFGGMAAQTLGAAVRIGLPAALGEGEATVADLSGKIGLPEAQLRRLLRATAALGLTAEIAPDLFAGRPVLARLAPGDPSALGDFVRAFTDPTMVQAWFRLEDSLADGAPAFDTVFGAPFFDHLAEQPELSASFNAAMRAGTAPIAGQVAETVDLGAFGTVVDVGGGDGTLLAALLAANPDLRGTVLDTAPGSAEAAATFERAGVSGRAGVEVGDFFTAVPGADAYLMKSIVHDWDDEVCRGLLRRCREGLSGPDGRVFVVEPVLPDTVGDDASAGIYLSDLNMLVNVGGKERTRAEFDALFDAAGLRTVQVHRLPAGFAVLEAAPA
ncbi:methyltransferase [Pseudonocardia phyllosphaerae]|uniref:methyltransferase n=1 Tax=Pseudonocardia phyllosphaerae TaxID=3390502 RepID=UPI00397955D4